MYKCENGYNDTANRDTCNCGWRGNPFVIIHGRPYNYTKNGVFNTDTWLNYNSMGGYRIKDIKEITRSEFNSLGFGSNRHHGDQVYEWVDHDGDGYGWVFCGGPIYSTGNVVGTLEYIYIR